MIRLVSLSLATLLLAGLAATAQANKSAGGLRCTLTNKTIQKCCCKQRGKKLYCTLAKKAIQKCCCVSAHL